MWSTLAVLGSSIWESSIQISLICCLVKYHWAKNQIKIIESWNIQRIIEGYRLTQVVLLKVLYKFCFKKSAGCSRALESHSSLENSHPFQYHSTNGINRARKPQSEVFSLHLWADTTDLWGNLWDAEVFVEMQMGTKALFSGYVAILWVSIQGSIRSQGLSNDC